ncbi:MAG TPA: circadian clock KaiB family protein [Steroidobacteraceae bacterium]
MIPAEKYELRLYVTGMTPRSTRAIESVRAICEEHLAGRYDLEIIDVYQTPGRITQDHVVAIPTLIKATPVPMRQLVGDMSNRQRLLQGLGLPHDD